jgi:microcystin-dependent protein
MGTPFLGEVKIFAHNLIPQGWALCNGQFLPINQNQALFSILGTQYGGNGQTNFALPNFRGRIPVHQGAGFNVGQTGGQEAHTVTMSEMPAHNHFVQCSTVAGTLIGPNGNVWGTTTQNPYAAINPNTAMFPTTISNTGGSQPHNNMAPYLVLNFIIALQGLFPSQN